MARGEREEGFLEGRSGMDGYGRRERSPRERSPGPKRGWQGDHRGRGGRVSDDNRGGGDWSRDGERRHRYPGSYGEEGRDRSEREEDYYSRSTKRDRHGRMENISPSPERENYRERERDRRRRVDSGRERMYESNRISKESPPTRRLRQSSSHNEQVSNYSDGVDGDTDGEEDRRQSQMRGVDRRRETSPKAINRQKNGMEHAVRIRERDGNGVENDRQAAPTLVDYADNDEDRGDSARKSAKDDSSSREQSDDFEDRSNDQGRETSSSGSSEDEKERARSKKMQKHEKRGRHSERKGKKRKHRRSKSGRGRDDSSESYTNSSGSSDISDSEEEERRRKKRKRRRRKEKEREQEREMKKKLKKKMKELKEKKLKSERKKKHREMRSKKPITTSWGKYGILKDIDMWNKRPEFTAWLAEVKKVNMESLANWEEKQMFKEYMEDYNTATFPSKKFYNLDIYHRRKAAKERMKGMAILAKAKVERTEFNDEDDRRVELLKEREQQKEAEVESLVRKMQSGMAQDMKEQAKLREEMQYQFRLGNTEAAQAIQRRLDPDAEKFTK